VESAPEPTWIVSETPFEAFGPLAKLAMPVRLPGRMLEIPPIPVTKNAAGMGFPLTLAAEPPLGPLLPKDPLPEEFAPGNGVSSTSPLVVGTIIPKLAIARRQRPSSMHSLRSGRNINRSFMLDAHAPNPTDPRLSFTSNWTDRSVRDSS